MSQPTPNPHGFPRQDDPAIRLLEKALLAGPEDWETRGYLLRHSIAAGNWAHARALLTAAPCPASTEDDLLAQAKVEAQGDSDAAIRTLTALLERNKACAQAYLQWA